MAWFAISTYPGHEEKVKALILKRTEEKHIPLEFFILPSKNTKLHEGCNKEEKQIGILFVNIDDIGIINDIKPFIELRDKEKMHVLYNYHKKEYILIPDNQMDIFKRIHPEEIEELMLLNRPFPEYAINNQRFIILEGPFKEIEGYKINLHKQKKLAVNIGGITMAISNLYSYKIARVFEDGKDDIFCTQQLDRIICHLIACLQVNGYPDDAYEQLRFLVSECHNFDNDIQKLQNYLCNCRAKSFIKSLDGITAGLIQSLAIHFFKEDNNVDIEQIIKDKTILPFLTPTSGILKNNTQKMFSIDHEEYTEVVKKVAIKEYRNINGTSKLTTLHYYAHVGINKKTGVIFSTFDAIHDYYRSLTTDSGRISALEQLKKAEAPLYPIIINSSVAQQTETPTTFPDQQTIDDYIQERTKAVEHLLSAPRLTIWRNILPQVIIHHE